MTPPPGAIAALEPCEYQGQHPRIDEQLGQLEDRADKHDAKIEAIERSTSGIREELAGMRGELRGALWASKVSGAVIGSLIGLVGGSLVALFRKG